MSKWWHFLLCFYSLRKKPAFPSRLTGTIFTRTGKYTAAVDMWSVGCICCEILGRRPLFPGKNFVHQLQLIFDVIGTPAKAEVAHIRNRQVRVIASATLGNFSLLILQEKNSTELASPSSRQALQFLRSLPRKGRADIQMLYPFADKQASVVVTHEENRNGIIAVLFTHSRNAGHRFHQPNLHL